MKQAVTTGIRVADAQAAQPRAGAGDRVPPAAARRRLAQALTVAALAMGAGSALAQPFFSGRMSPDERDRFRRELRQQQEPDRRGDPQAWRRERMSPPERDQLRRQLREARPDERRGGGRRRD